MTIDGGKVVIRLEGKDVNLTQVISKLEREMKGSQSTANDFMRTMNKLPPGLQRTERESLQYATALARIEALQGRSARGAAILAAEIGKISPNTVAGANAIANLQKQMNQYEASAERARQKSLNFATDMATGFNRLIGAGFAVQGIASIFTDIVQKGNELEKTQTTVRALAGSQEEYNKVLAIAKKQQDLYGGSINENLENLSGFIYTARQAGVEVDELANIARRLAIVDPVQGFKGASIALKEFFSGDIVSLARRFEIPRDLLRDINSLGSQAEKLAALDKVLSDMGLTQDLLTSQAETTAVAYEKMSGSFQDMVAIIGQGLAQTLEPAANRLTEIFSAAAEGINQLNNTGAQMDDFQARLLLQTDSLEDYNARIDEWNRLLAESNNLQMLTGSFEKLNEQQREFAIHLTETGSSATEAYNAVSELGHVSTLLEDTYAGIGVRMEEGAGAIQTFNEAAFGLSTVLQDGGETAAFWAGQVSLGNITADEAARIMQQLTIQRQLDNAEIVVQADNQAGLNSEIESGTAQLGVYTQELSENIQKKVDAQIEAKNLADAEAYLASLADYVNAGLISNADAASIMEQRFRFAKDEALRLIDALAALRRADSSIPGVTGRQQGGYGGTGFNADLESRTEKALAAERAYQYAVGDTTRKLELKRRELSKTTKGSAEYYDALTDVERLEKQLASEQERAAKGSGSGGSNAKGSTKKSAATKELEDRVKDEKKLREQLEDVQTDFLEKREEAEREHVENITEIYEDFYEEQRKLAEENEIGKRRSRFDFYSGLDPESGIDTAAFAAQYEEIFAEAQRIAQEGKLALSQEFLELRQSQLEEMMDLEKEIADIQADEDLSKREKADRVAYLEGLKKLLQEAQAEELQQLLEGGDEALDELNARLTEEEKRYAEQTTKIAEEAGKQADEKVKAAERGREAILLENEALQAQYDLLRNIGTEKGGPNTGTTIPLAPQTPTSPIPVQVQPNPIQTPPQTVSQLEIWNTHDAVLNGTMLAVGARLESQLANIITAIDTSRDAITRSLSNVETSISRIGKGSLLNK